jgi:hypothetical protein
MGGGEDEGRRQSDKLEGFESFMWTEILTQWAHRNQKREGAYS